MAFGAAAEEFNPYEGTLVPRLTSVYPEGLRPARALLGREERVTTFKKGDEYFQVRKMDKVAPEDWVLSSARASLYASRRGEPYRGSPPAREYRAALLFADRVI